MKPVNQTGGTGGSAFSPDPTALRFRDRMGVLVQYLVPTVLLSTWMFHLTRVRIRPYKNLLIRWFIRHYGVDMTDAETADPNAYQNFNLFFTRSLLPEARPVAVGSVVSPVDGVLSQVGTVYNGSLVQAKRREYALLDLLGGDRERCALFARSRFATLYLSPKDYHRVHMPVGGHVQEMSYLPGRLFSVSPSTTRLIPNLFAKNERMLAVFDTELGPMAMILVGAVFVGSIQTVWNGVLTPPHGGTARTWRYDDDDNPALSLSQGQEMGRFNMGSTVILLLPAEKVSWRSELRPGAELKMGHAIGDIIGT